jgi:phosphodiesterase/alkaline phosphatase D-like protein
MTLRAPLPLILAAAGLALAPGGAGAAAFPDGVAAGDAGPTSALLWTRAERPGTIVVRVGATRDLHAPVARRTLATRAATGRVARVTIRGLRPRTRYWFRFSRGASRSALGSFRTAPAAGSERRVRFSVLGGIDPAFDPGLGVVARAAAHAGDFTILLGDTVGAGPGDGHAAYRRLLARPPVRALRAATGLYAVPGVAEDAYGRRAFEAAVPVSGRRDTGYYRSLRWGKAVELFLLDERSYRSPPAIVPACDNSRSGAPDAAPTLPDASRLEYTGFYYPLGAPVAPACLRAQRSPRRTMLGGAQLAALRRGIARSTARFKVVLSEAAMTQSYFLPYHRWEGYEHERQKLVALLRDEVDNVVVLSAGSTGSLVGDVRLRTLEAPGVANGGFDDIGIGPAAAPTFYSALEQQVGPGTGDTISRLFLKRAPPYGAGMRCAATNVLNYAEVTVSGSLLTVALRGADGHAIRDADGGRCGPFRFEADSFTHKPE